MKTGTEKQMDELTLQSIIDQKIKDGSGSIGTSEGELSIERQETFDYYMGEPLGNEQDGQSSVVTREVLETIEWAMPSLMRVFAASDKVVEFDPTGQEDEAAAEQETDYVNHVFLKKNNGYEVIHNWIKSGLLYPAAYVKVWWEETEETKTEQYTGLSMEEASMLAQSEGIEVVGQEQDEMGLISMEVRYTDKGGRAVVQTVPEEELILDANLESISLDNADFVAHRTRKLRSDLVEAGYDEKALDMVGSQDTGTYNSERVNRRFRTDENDYFGDETEIDKTMQAYWVDEVYLKVDWDGDGIAELRRVVKIGDKIFENEPADMIPFASWSSIMMPHKHLGLSFGELVKDLQRVKTVMMREMLNNLHRTNNPRTIVGQGVNLDDLLSNRANGIIRTKSMTDLSVEPTQSVIANVIPAMNLIDQQKEVRTGVSRSSMGLDADVLARSTKGAYMGAMEQANQRLELVARNFAEVGLKSLFLKLHQLLLTHMDKADVVKLRGQWVQVNPTEWRERSDMTIHVGIGNGNKEQQMQALMGIINIQKEMLGTGLGGVTVTPNNLYNAVTKLTELSGFRNANKFFQNPAEAPPPQPPKPDPQEEFVKMQAQIEQQKLELKQMEMQMKNATDNRKIDAAIAKDMTELELKYAADVPGAVI